MNRVLCIGDSTRIGYEPWLASLLGPEIELIRLKKFNCGGTLTILKHLETWLSFEPDLVHLNTGLHDLKRAKVKESSCRISLDDYYKNLNKIVTFIEKKSRATLVLATTTPVNHRRQYRSRNTSMRFDRDVRNYNRVIKMLAKTKGFALNDLYREIQRAGRDRLLLSDGVHFTQRGHRLLAKRVGRVISQILTC